MGTSGPHAPPFTTSQLAMSFVSLQHGLQLKGNFTAMRTRLNKLDTTETEDT